MRSTALCETKYLTDDETGISIVILLLVNSIPLTVSACKAPAHLCPSALEAGEFSYA